MKKCFYIILLFFNLILAGQDGFNLAIDYHTDSIDLCEGYTDLTDSDSGLSIQRIDNNFLVFGFGWASEYCGRSALKLWGLDEKGEVLWQKIYGSDTSIIGPGKWGNLIACKDGNFAAAGTYIYNEERDGYLIKFSPEGDLIWLQIYNAPMEDILYDGIELPEGGFVLTGLTRSFGKGNANNTDIYLIKTDSLGNALWKKGIGTYGDEHGEGIELLPDGQFLISGVKINNTIDSYLIKVDAEGKQIWSKIYGTPVGNDCPAKVILASDGNYLMRSCSDTLNNVSDKLLPKYIAKLQPNGNIIWKTYVNLDYHVSTFTIKELEDGSVIGLGYWAKKYMWYQQGYIVKLNEDGEKLWERVIWWYDNKFNAFHDLTEDVSGDLILTGTTYTDSQDMWLVKLSPDGCLSEIACDSLTYEPPVYIADPSIFKENKCAIYPNPLQAKDKLYIRSLSRFYPVRQILIYNVLGENLLTEKVQKGDVKEVRELNTPDLPFGTYFLQIHFEDGHKETHKIMIHK